MLLALWGFVLLAIAMMLFGPLLMWFVAGLQLGGYVTYNEINIGVAYESGGADYAEWLKKADPNEILNFGDVVGVKGGAISRSFTDAEKFMVISQNPMISAAMPEEGKEQDYEKVAFIGQVPVKVLGEASVGDYIVSAGNTDGFAIAIAPDAMKIKDYRRIVGVAWSDAQSNKVFNYVQTAIGINNNDLTKQVERMQSVMNAMQNALERLDPQFKAQLFDVDSVTVAEEKTKPVSIQERVANRSGKLVYTSLKEALEQTQVYAVDRSDFDVMKLPFIQEVINNPTKENAEKLIEYYTKVLNKLNRMQPKRP